MMNIRKILAAAILVAATGGAAQAQLTGDWAQRGIRSDGCERMTLEIVLSGQSKGDDRLRDRVRNAAESRLRSADLFKAPPTKLFLQVGVLSTGPAGSREATVAAVRVSLFRILGKTAADPSPVAIVWHQTTIGPFDDIRETLAELGDMFLTEYLRANPECGRG